MPHEQIVLRTRILVIDDGDFPYLKLLERDGYTIEKWADVEDLSRLEGGRFDVIRLDLRRWALNDSVPTLIGPTPT